MNFTAALNPRSRDIQAYIDIDLVDSSGASLPYTARVDSDLNCRLLYEAAKRGEFGEVALAPDENHIWNGEQWMAIPVDHVAEAEAEKHHKMNQANQRIALLQDAVELGIANDAEKALFNRWRQYRVLLSRVDTSTAPDIVWPEPPQE